MPPFVSKRRHLCFLGVTETIEVLQPLMNFFNKDLYVNAYLVTIYEKIWYFSELKTIDVHCLGSNVSSIFTNMYFS